jgi:dTMP kinase
MLKNKGKLIVIDGTDGSGKTTQAKLLVENLKQQGKQAYHHKFPQYDEFYGQLVAKFLRGELGTLSSINPYLASLPYALDRLSAKPKLTRLLKTYDYVILDRYMSSNIGHQASRFDDQNERNEFIDWLNQAEYKVNKIPKEDLVIFLHVPTAFSIKLRTQTTDKNYLNGKNDIIESDIQALHNTEQTYLYCASKYKHWKKIDCVKNDQLLSIEAIQQLIISALE